MKSKILIVDDSPADRVTFKKWIEEWGYEPIEAPDSSTAEKVAGESHIAAVIMNYRLPDFDGFELFRRINKVKAGLPMILITDTHRPELTIQAMSEGFYHYMPKPVDMDELRIHLDRAINLKNMKTEFTRIKAGKGEDRFIGSCPKMLEVYRLIGMFANNDSPVLIYGETGTGKELVARLLHKYSDRRNDKFITLHISVLTNNLVESELFGHEKGAFTGAEKRHIGRFEAAGKGSLFVDELADIPLDTQAKLLRVMEYREYTTVGGEVQLRSEARLIVASNRKPEDLMKEGGMREDLRYRLDVCRIDLPPLRDRTGDIKELVSYFVTRENTSQKRDIIGVSNEVMETWHKYSWPGNVRQLRNVIKRAVSITRDSIITNSFLQDEPDTQIPESTVNSESKIAPDEPLAEPQDLKEEIAELEHTRIIKALRAANGKLAQAAKLIGLTRRELEWRMNKYEINADEFKS